MQRKENIAWILMVHICYIWTNQLIEDQIKWQILNTIMRDVTWLQKVIFVIQ